MLLVMAGVAAIFIKNGTAFGLFKLAMFAQPFLVGSIVLGWARMNPGRWKLAALLGLIALVPLQAATQRKYVSLSANGEFSSLAPGATREHLLTQYWNGLQTPGAERFLVPVNDELSWRLLGCFGRGRTLCFPAKEQKLFAHPLEINGHMSPNWSDIFNLQLLTPYASGQWFYPPKKQSSIDLLDPSSPKAASTIEWNLPSWVDRPQPGDYLLEPPERYSLFNRYHRSPDARECRTVALSEVRNYLVWRSSSLARVHNPAEGEMSGMCLIQADPLYPQDTMAASGQYLTFQVLNPSSQVRVLLSGTATYITGEHELHPTAAVGDRRVSLPSMGRGAARVVSEPISLQAWGPSKYLLLDLNRPLPLPDIADAALAHDRRQISLYLRDVSLLSEEDYAAMVPPEKVETFPAGLAQKHLEYSGCAEDGRVGMHSWFRLSQPQTAGSLVVRGKPYMKDPNSNEGNGLVVRWKGVEVGRQTIKSAEFECRVELPRGVGPGKLELEFSVAHRVLPSGHSESAQLTFVGFEP